MQVLVCLAEHAGDLVTRQELVDAVWAAEFISDNTVTHAITELRNALGDVAKSPEFIETIHRRGYRLVAPVEWLGGEGGEYAVQVRTGKTRWPHLLAIGIAAVIGLLVILPPEALFERQGETPTDEPVPRIVVLPFENLGPPEDEYFADGITQELISRLAAVSGLQVISRTSAMYYKGKSVPLKQIGDELDIGYVLEGTIRWDRSGGGHGRVRITPQLIRVADDSHLWSERYDRVLEDIFEVQSNIARSVISELEATILESEGQIVQAEPTNNVEAYRSYLEALAPVNHNEQSLSLSIQALQRAVSIDPEFAAAHAMLCVAHSGMYQLRFDFNPSRLDQAKASVDRAMALAPELPEGHLALGYYYYSGFRDYSLARAHFSAALRTLPNEPRVLKGIFYVARRQGRWGEALEALETWQRSDPRGHVHQQATETFTLLRRYEEAYESMRRAIVIDPDDSVVYYFGVRNFLLWDGETERAWQLIEAAPDQHSQLNRFTRLLLHYYDRDFATAAATLSTGPPDNFENFFQFVPSKLEECICLHEMGKLKESRAACVEAERVLRRELAERPHDYRLWSSLGRALAILGRSDEAVRVARKSVDMVPLETDSIFGSHQMIELATVYAQVGEVDMALDLIDELLSIPSTLSVGLLRLDPAWDPLRDDPRFQALLEKYDTVSN